MRVTPTPSAFMFGLRAQEIRDEDIGYAGPRATGVTKQNILVHIHFVQHPTTYKLAFNPVHPSSHAIVTLIPLLSNRGNGKRNAQAGSASVASVSYSFIFGPCGQKRAAKTIDISA